MNTWENNTRAWLRKQMAYLAHHRRKKRKNNDAWHKWSESRAFANYLRFKRKKREPQYIPEYFTWDSVLKKFSTRLCRKVHESESDQWSKWSRRADTINTNYKTHWKGYGQEVEAAD